MIKKLLLFLSLLLMMTFNMTDVTAKSSDEMYIIIDLWTKELVVREKDKVIKRYQVSIGTESSPTPIGTYIIVEKSKEWGGGFGSRWLGLNVPWGKYGIHGTNKPYLIGEQVSSGCIRMHNKDIEDLYEFIPQGTKVIIVGPITGIGEGEFKNLSIGSKGNLVQLVQRRLKGLGLYEGEIDGIYGSNTDWAMRKFQKLNNIRINGVTSIQEYQLLGLLE